MPKPRVYYSLNFHIASVQILQGSNLGLTTFFEFSVFYIFYINKELYLLNKFNLLSRFNIDTLDLRRKLTSITFVYKSPHSRVDSSELLSPINSFIRPVNTRKSRAFYFDRARNLYLKYPIYRMCHEFNAICDSCGIHCDHLNLFLVW